MQVQGFSLDLAASRVAALSVQAEDRLEMHVAPSSTASASSPSAGPADDSVDVTDPKTLLARWLFEYLTGHKAPAIRTVSMHRSSAAAARGASSSVTYTHREVRTESEATSFTASGKVQLQSGEEIAFSIRLDLARQETATSTATFSAGNMTDPIVVNFDGKGARLTADRQAFDLNGDGADEMIATLAAGSAWLARDGNGNGTIDNGGELFGPTSGNGFAEMAAIDSDGNGWLDEGDSYYSQLGVWRDRVFTPLSEAGIGALSVASVSTPFTLKSGAEILGQVRSSGVYLREDGTPGMLQQVDIAG
jgi:hypothetical protein